MLWSSEKRIFYCNFQCFHITIINLKENVVWHKHAASDHVSVAPMSKKSPLGLQSHFISTTPHWHAKPFVVWCTAFQWLYLILINNMLFNCTLFYFILFFPLKVFFLRFVEWTELPLLNRGEDGRKSRGSGGKTKQVEGGPECSLANKSIHIYRHFGVHPSH